MIGRRGFLAGVGAVVVLAACSGSSSEDDDATDTTAVPAGGDGADPTGTTVPEQRILLLGEEYLLADALSLGVRPVASTATLFGEGFIGVDDFDTDGIEVLDNTDQDLERLVTLDSEVVIAAQYVVDAVGEEALAPFGELTIVPTGSTNEEVLLLLAGLFGKEAEAEALLDELAAAEERARTEIPDQTVSVVSIYSGPSVAVFADGPWAVPDALLKAGCTLVPDASEPHDANGRVYISLERLDLVGGDAVILLTAPAVEGELDAFEEITADPLWTELPGPAAGRVHEIGRLDYPGVAGRIRLVDDLIEILG